MAKYLTLGGLEYFKQKILGIFAESSVYAKDGDGNAHITKPLTISGSVSEGYETTASGEDSHAEGNNTTASGEASHAEGKGTIASQANQHVSGKYNVEDTNGDYAFIVGNGTDDDTRSNAFAIDWNGNLALFKVNGTAVTLSATQLEEILADDPMVEVANSVASQTMTPNTLYVFTNRTSALTLTMGTAVSGKVNEYHCIIECGSSAPTITWPSGISWNGGSAPTIAANKKYEVSILNNIATYIEV